MSNISSLDKKVVSDFGKEWSYFDHKFNENSFLKKIFDDYFYLLPLKKLKKKIGFDLGCGSGRWAKFILPFTKRLNCIEPSTKAINKAKINLKNFKNVKFFNSFPVNGLLPANSQDFGYCLGVLHHTSDTESGIKFSNKILKKNGYFLLYLYYNFENRNEIYKIIWKVSDQLRLVISGLSFKKKIFVTNLIALFIYFPISRFCKLLNFFNISSKSIPLNYYKDKKFYTMKNDSLDRFGTKIEKRFSKKQIKNMLKKNGFYKIKFSKKEPFWTVICQKK